MIKYVDGAAVEMTADEVAAVTAMQLPSLKSGMIDAIISLRTNKLSAGFNYNFGDARGVHRIGTTESDLAGWDEVSKASSAMIATGASSGTINIVTDTGPATVTALEFQSILLAAAAFRQPIWGASFTLQASIAAAADQAALDAVDITTGWPA